MTDKKLNSNEDEWQWKKQNILVNSYVEKKKGNNYFNYLIKMAKILLPVNILRRNIFQTTFIKFQM